MCRLFLSVNKQLDEITIMNFFSQSNKKANTPGLSNPLDADYHMDGYGVAWLDPDDELAIYKSANAYCADENFLEIRDHLVKCRLVIAHLRNKGTASVGAPGINNSHPFIYSRYLLAHNGYIENFTQHKEKILNFVSNKYFEKISGETDTEHLFYCLLTIIDQLGEKHIEDGYTCEEIYKMAWTNLFKLFADNSIELVGNFIFFDMKKIMIIRYVSTGFGKGKTKQEPPSLYYCSDVSKSRVIVCSEPVGPYYFPVESNTFTTFNIN